MGSVRDGQWLLFLDDSIDFLTSLNLILIPKYFGINELGQSIFIWLLLVSIYYFASNSTIDKNLNIVVKSLLTVFVAFVVLASILGMYMTIWTIKLRMEMGI